MLIADHPGSYILIADHLGSYILIAHCFRLQFLFSILYDFNMIRVESHGENPLNLTQLPFN